MKGVILAGGLGTRLNSLTRYVNKHLLPVGKEPMIFNPVKQLISAGIDEILIITSTEHMGAIVNTLGSGQKLGCSLTYKVQETPSGIAHALMLAEGFVNGDQVVVILGDNICDTSIKKNVDAFRKQNIGARVLLKKVDDPVRYGVAAIDEKNIVEIVEKPSLPKSDYAVLGYYMYDNKVFDFIKKIKPSDRNELEITSVNNMYINNGELFYDILKGNWTDAGTFESLRLANNILFAVDNNIQETENL
ncbi:spore coat protein [Bacillus sp. M6-12]|uniref:sugar phosphate nucleotidyltransferase n=1 Tax=Bacillus sp. M6-12 TaxID=2054166 RepID=UPI000C78E636|nr:sugar phosphate nucleotidyltransferase [Bacillus sp. M6-12]PLS17879.1 spore coat protein [Bacillus sp. M6-12]